MTIKEKISLLPHSPGVYRYYNSEGTVIYVGKAKDLHKRVAQYFIPSERLNNKTRLLVSKIADVQYSVVDSESDALLLENNLIKQYKPKYNILLKDSKTYPWICITSDPFPKVFLTRRIEQNGSRYFGPYSSVFYAKSLLGFLKENYPLRTCNYNINKETIASKKIRPCLDFHIGRCKGCCIGDITEEDYNSDIEEIVKILKGGTGELIKHYKLLMSESSENLEFEKAREYLHKIEALQQHYSKSIIASETDRDVDVFSIIFDANEAFGNFLRIRGGSIIQSLNLGFKMNIEEEQSSVLSLFIAEINSKFGKLAEEVIVPFFPDVELDGVNFKIPVRGDKLALLELSAKNAKEYHFHSIKQREHTNPDEYSKRVLEELQKTLGMKELPVHIECFDNSNIQGTNPVAACVVFREGRPAKKDYRKFKVKTVVGANDYATMTEIVTRRYSRMLEEAPDDLPELIVIDGGKGQLECAYKALFELGLTEKLTVIGLAERMELVFRVGDPYPLFIDRNSGALKILQHIRDEAHRFGISFHRDLRSKSALFSVLREIDGVGEKTEQRLILHYGSVARIATASIQDLTGLVGEKLAIKINKKLNNI